MEKFSTILNVDIKTLWELKGPVYSSVEDQFWSSLMANKKKIEISVTQEQKHRKLIVVMVLVLPG